MSSMIDDHSFEKVPRNFPQMQLDPQTRSSFDDSNSRSQTSGTIDMSFNRQSLDWSRLQLFAPHSTGNSQHVTNKATEPRSSKDLYDLLQDWNFPSQPTVPPRMLVWGPYNKSDSHWPPLEALASSMFHVSASQISFPQTPPPYCYKAPKRRREAHMPPSQPHFVTPIAFTKRPRTVGKAALGFPASPRYTKHEVSNYSCPIMTSPNREGVTFPNDYSIDHTPLRTPFSPRYPNYQQNPSVYSRNPPHHHPESYHPNHFKSPSSCLKASYDPNPNYMNPFYLPSPISPATPFSPPPSLSPHSKFSHPQSPCANRQRHPNPKNSYHSNIWSREWHQTFNQFRNEQGTY